MTATAVPVDVVALVRRLAARPRVRGPDRASLRGLDGTWRIAEQTLLRDIMSAPRRGGGIVRAFVRLAEIAGEDEARGRAARLEGSYLAQSGRYEASLSRYEEAAARLDGAARDGALLGLAGSLVRCGRRADAEGLCAKVRRSALRRGERTLAAAADLNAGGARHESGDPTGAIPLYRRALAEFAAAGDARREAVAAMDLANALVLVDRYDDAAPLYERAIDAYGRLGLARDAAICRYNRGALLVALDRLGDAEETLAAAEASFRSLGDETHAALCRIDRADALFRARLHPEAREMLRSAERGVGRATPPMERARATLLLARVELALGNAAAARRLFRRHLPVDAPVLRAERTELAGRAAALGGRFRAARAMLERAADGFGRQRPGARSRALAAAAWCALQSGDTPAARRLVSSAALAAERVGVPGLEHAAHAVAFLVEADAGDTPRADAALRRALAALERVRAGLGPDAMRAAVLDGSDAWFARAIRHLLERHPGAVGETAALELLERWRARALVDLMGDAARTGTDGAERPDRVAASSRIEALRSRVAALERRLEGTSFPGFLRTGAGAAPSHLVRALAVAERRLREAFRREPGPQVAPVADLTRLVDRVPDGTTIVTLHADERSGRAFVLDARGLHVIDGLAREGEIARLVEELGFRLGKFTLGPEFASRHRNQLAWETDEILAALARGTLAPLANVLRATRRLVMVPHGPWHRVPFAALPFREGRLADEIAVASTPSLGSLADEPPSAAGRPLVLAIADERAPAIEEEGRAVARVLPDAQILEGGAARSDALRSRSAPTCVHVAAHGRFRHDAPALSGVRLADGWLHAGALRHMALAGSTVVLSGCDTGVSAVAGHGEALGLVRSVLAAGAAELVVSLWRVEDASTARLMERMHHLRADGFATEDALRHAQREVADRGLHPWYWAGFTVWTRRLEARGDEARAPN